MTDCLKVEGRKGLKLIFDCKDPEKYLVDRKYYGKTDEEVKETLKKPFIVARDIFILIDYNEKGYCIKIPNGYTWNGANVPPFAWLTIGQKESPRFKVASCVHDYLCEHHEVIDNDRYLSTLIFETLCRCFGKFNDFKCWVMFHSVDNYQKVFGKWKKL